ncbi:uncharacterized protein LOC106162084 isoform X2 [Lingula anatina]|uniref:Uncharacterized protein LOC106162084 isoform X2 n=1 Tax=Lingula anatina TaxID=7574 RepID=A0A1S3I9Y3_LINAN|nr:uncharacterized protein LOC106162084 isoform X2 [Lingula anatina]XP_013394666.1 uncharacterized protein LOC106162084 isoform X2 [Lingula anatina]|eukprot:XP_013394665.1 uncharacterized protein LOC106162084 isoform X2 [Lingula anatina]
MWQLKYSPDEVIFLDYYLTEDCETHLITFQIELQHGSFSTAQMKLFLDYHLTEDSKIHLITLENYNMAASAQVSESMILYTLITCQMYFLSRARVIQKAEMKVDRYERIVNRSQTNVHDPPAKKRLMMSDPTKCTITPETADSPSLVESSDDVTGHPYSVEDLSTCENLANSRDETRCK